MAALHARALVFIDPDCSPVIDNELIIVSFHPSKIASWTFHVRKLADHLVGRRRTVVTNRIAARARRPCETVLQVSERARRLPEARVLRPVKPVEHAAGCPMRAAEDGLGRFSNRRRQNRKDLRHLR